MRVIPGMLALGGLGLLFSGGALYYSESDAIAHSGLEVRRNVKKVVNCHPHPSLEGQLVYAQCTMDPSHMGPITSSAFTQLLKKPAVDGLLAGWMHEEVQMWQWKETKVEVVIDDKPTGEEEDPDEAAAKKETEISHSYTADWYEWEFYISNKEHAPNPKMEAFSNKHHPFIVPLVGGYGLSGAFQVPKLKTGKTIDLPQGKVAMKSEADGDKLPDTRFTSFEANGEWLYALQEGSTVDNIQIGDMRVRFIQSSAMDVTIVAAQQFDKETGDFSFLPWRKQENPWTKETHLANVNWLHEGFISLDEMIDMYGPQYNAPVFRGLWRTRLFCICCLAAAIYCLAFGVIGRNSAVPVLIAFATIPSPLIVGVNVLMIWRFNMSALFATLFVFPSVVTCFAALVAGGMFATRQKWQKPLDTAFSTLNKAATGLVQETHVEAPIDPDVYLEAPSEPAEKPRASIASVAAVTVEKPAEQPEEPAASGVNVDSEAEPKV
eukprot:GDKI01020574.1.p2 GENE.GDKI01020574.1~~GDKI01020574.1.p2  ORF type:complete len:492 (-),score=193.29 GDKI01020574.1:272-1747(-)